MSRTIWKFGLTFKDSQSFEMPRDAEILCVGLQDECINIWAEVVPERHRQMRHFEIRGTGHSIDPSMEKKYLGTVFLKNGLVFHVFERISE